MYVKLL